MENRHTSRRRKQNVQRDARKKCSRRKNSKQFEHRRYKQWVHRRQPRRRPRIRSKHIAESLALHQGVRNVSRFLLKRYYPQNPRRNLSGLLPSKRNARPHRHNHDKRQRRRRLSNRPLHAFRVVLSVSRTMYLVRQTVASARDNFTLQWEGYADRK